MDKKNSHITKYLTGEASEKELERILMRSSKLEELGDADKKNFKSFIVANYLSDLSTKNFDPDKAYDQFVRQYKKEPKIKHLRLRSIYRWTAVAAVFLMGLFYFFTHTTGKAMVFATRSGESRTLTLPDGTLVILNNRSVLKYPKQFVKKDRIVHLEGEAFFDVKHNENKPFRIYLPSDLKIKVLGTRFNVRAYPEDSKIETTLFSGKVTVGLQKNSGRQSFLKPGEKAQFIKADKRFVIKKVSHLNDVVAWQSNKLIFRKSNLQDIVNELNRFYGTDIVIAEENLKQQEFTASFKQNTGPEEILKSLQVTGNFNLKKTDKLKWIITKRK